MLGVKYFGKLFGLSLIFGINSAVASSITDLIMDQEYSTSSDPILADNSEYQ